MKRIGLLLALALMIALLPLGTLAQDDLAGRWSGALDDATITLLLGQDGAYILLSDEAGDVESMTGSWTQEPGLVLLNNGDDTVRLAYVMENGVMTAWEEGDDANKAALTRVAWQPTEGLAGLWEGGDSTGAFRLSLGRDNAYSLDYLAGAPISAGRFADYNDTLYMAAQDGTQLIFGYSFTPDGLTIVNQSNRSAFPLKRQDVPAMTEAPAPTAAPAVTEAPAPTDEPPAVTEPPAGLHGTWRGTDATGEHTITLREDGGTARTYTDPANAAVNETGFFIFNENVILVTIPGGETRQMRYLLLGDSLLLSDVNLQNPVTYTRVLAAPEPAGLDPALLGTWGGYGETPYYFELTFQQGGAFQLQILPDESGNRSGTATLENGTLTLTHAGGVETYAVTLSGDTLNFGADNPTRRLSGPLSREPLPDAVVSAAVDPALVGVWGGMMEPKLYAEFAFLPDGRFIGFSPLTEPDQDSGNYLASQGGIAILSLRYSAQGTYALEGDTFTLSLAGREPFTLFKKDGLLRRLPETTSQP